MSDRLTDATRGGDDAAAWGKLEALLEERRAAAEKAIREYPTPIAGCDAQFNHLLDQRAGIPLELARLRAARDGAGSGTGTRAALVAFVETCPWLGPADLDPSDARPGT